jgi:hypothetical protein
MPITNAPGVLTLNTLRGIVGETSPNSTITISISGQNITFDINLSNANIWAALQTFGNNISIGGAQYDIGKVSVLATGDIIFYDGTNWINLAVGTGTQVLGVSGGHPAWVAGGGGTVGNSVQDFELTTTNPTLTLTYTPLAQGNYMLAAYVRVVTAPTVVSLEWTWSDVTNAVTYHVWKTLTIGVTGAGHIPIFINATTAAISLTATAGTANQVYVSASIRQV